MLRKLRYIVWTLSTILAGSAAIAEDQPLLMLDTGGHQALIDGVAFTQDGAAIVSAGEDKVIRVWDWRGGATQRTLRGESGPGPHGKIYAMALSPDNRWLAVAGSMAPAQGDGKDIGAIRLYDFKTGTLKALLKGHDKEVLKLAFSPGSDRLISGGYDHFALIWDVPQTEPILRLEAHSAALIALSFTSDGKRVLTGSDDKKLLLWDAANGRLLKEMPEHGDKITALAASPAGGVASGDASGDIRLFDGESGKFLRRIGQVCDSAGALAFSPDGKLLLATCGYRLHTDYNEKIFETATGKEMTVYSGHDDRVKAGAFSPDGSLVVTGGGDDRSIRVWDPRTGETKAVMKGAGRVVWGAGFSEDGTKIGWGNTWGDNPPGSHGPLEMAMSLPLDNRPLGVFEHIADEKNWVRERTSAGANSLKVRRGGALGYDSILDILANGKLAASIERTPIDGVIHSAVTFSADGTQVISAGAFGVLAAYDLKGKKIGDFIGHEGDVWAAAVSPNNKYLVSGGGDQTVRLWNKETRELIVSLFSGTDGEWVMWTPQGFYAGSPGAGKIVGWQVNKGPDAAAQFFTAEQLRNNFYRPDIVTKAIRLASAAEAVRTSYGTTFKIADLLGHPAPHLRISGAAVRDAGSLPGGAPASATVKIVLDPVPDPVTRIRIQVEGRQLEDFLPEGASFLPGELEFDVPLTQGQNRIVITALNATGWSKAGDGTITLMTKSAGELDKRGTLYIVAAGVTKYPGIAGLCPPEPNCDLSFTSNDAVAFADVVEERLGPLHSHVDRRVLVDEGKSDGAPTAAAIIDALGRLKRAKPNDTVAVFLAGHGFNEGPYYRFVSGDAALEDGEIRPSSVVPWYAIEEAIDRAKGLRLLFVDTCHSPGAFNERLGNTAYYDNILVYSSARWDQQALERGDLRHGLFTEALVEGLRGAADLKRQGRVDTQQLSVYLQKRVPELARPDEQNPQFFKGRDAEIYTLEVLK